MPRVVRSCLVLAVSCVGCTGTLEFIGEPNDDGRITADGGVGGGQGGLFIDAQPSADASRQQPNPWIDAGHRAPPIDAGSSVFFDATTPFDGGQTPTGPLLPNDCTTGTGGDPVRMNGIFRTAYNDQRGSQVFLRTCGAQTCHGSDGDRGQAPNLSASVRGMGYCALAKIILDGEGRMPSLSGLSDQDIADVIAYSKRQWP